MPRASLAATLLALALVGCTLLPVAQSLEPTSTTPMVSPPTGQPSAVPTAVSPGTPTEVAAATSVPPSATPTPSPTPLPTLSASATAEPTPEPPAGSDPTPTAVADFELQLRQLAGGHGLGEVLQVFGIAEQDFGLVAYGNVGQTEFDADYVVWFSADGIDWTAINPVAGNKDVRLYDIVGVVATTDGFVALGSAHNYATNVGSELVFKSVDGEHWIQRPTTPPEVGICGLTWFRDRFIGRGCDASMWTSTDAESWQQLDVPVLTGRCGGVWPVGGVLWASTRERYGTTCVGPISLWTSSDGVDWQKWGEPLIEGDDWFGSGEANDGYTFVAVTRPQSVGYAPNERHAWYLRDGSWHAAANAPRGAHAVLSTSGGFVAYGSCTWEGQDSDNNGYDDMNVLWTSPDGESWSYVAPSERGWFFDRAIVRDGKLIVIGTDDQRYMAGKPAASIWTADLPPEGEKWAETGFQAPPKMCQDP